MDIFWYIGGVLGGYLLGCVNTAAIIARIKGFDIRTKGSGNAGASNALVTMGKGAAAASAGVDILKAFLPVFLLLRAAVPSELPVIVGVSVILGHMYPFWMQFRGGKGFASLLGLTFALDWRLLIACLVILGLLLFTTKYIALASISCAVLTPVWYFVTVGSAVGTAALAVVAVIMVVKHIPNIKRIINKTEIKLGDKES